MLRQHRIVLSKEITINDQEDVAALQNSITLEFVILSIFLFENALDMSALLVYFIKDFSMFEIASVLALARLLLLTFALLIEQKSITGRSRGYFIARRIVMSLFWVAVATCSFMNTSYLPTILLLLVAMGIMIRENCRCSGEVN